MNKKLKVFIAIVLIAAIAIGVYYILGKKTENKQIRARVYELNNNLIVKGENVYNKINTTVDEMSKLIGQKGFNIPEVENYFNFYIETLNYYESLQDVILENGVFVNRVNTNDYFKKMNESYKKLKRIYLDGYDYLGNTYFIISPNSLTNADYLISFQNLFKDALNELNIFYFNAGMAYSYGVRNTYRTNNLNNLNVGYYSLLINIHVEDFLEDGKIDFDIEQMIQEQEGKIFENKTSGYIGNKVVYDELLKNSREINLKELVLKNIKGEYTTYLSEIKKANKKLIVEQYYELIIKG